jgi:hypothetical protein
MQNVFSMICEELLSLSKVLRASFYELRYRNLYLCMLLCRGNGGTY